MRFRAIGFGFGLACAAAASACDKSTVETPAGAKVEFEGNKTTVKTNDGQKASIENNGKTTVVRNAEGEKATITSQEGAVKIEGDRGSAEFGTKTLPAGFPLILPEGATIENAMHVTPADGDIYTVTASYDGDPKAAADAFEQQLKQKGLTTERSHQETGSVAVFAVNGKAENTEAQIAVTKQPDTRGRITLTWSKKK